MFKANWPFKSDLNKEMGINLILIYFKKIKFNGDVRNLIDLVSNLIVSFTDFQFNFIIIKMIISSIGAKSYLMP